MTDRRPSPAERPALARRARNDALRSMLLSGLIVQRTRSGCSRRSTAIHRSRGVILSFGMVIFWMLYREARPPSITTVPAGRVPAGVRAAPRQRAAAQAALRGAGP